MRNAASCWLYSENMLAMHGHMNVKFVKVTSADRQDGVMVRFRTGIWYFVACNSHKTLAMLAIGFRALTQFLQSEVAVVYSVMDAFLH